MRNSLNFVSVSWYYDNDSTSEPNPKSNEKKNEQISIVLSAMLSYLWNHVFLKIKINKRASTPG